MKHALYFSVLALLCFAFPSLAHGQNETISLSIAMPYEQKACETEVVQLLRNKLSSSMAVAALGMADYSGLLLTPVMTTTNLQVVEGGMRSITTLDVNLSLTVAQMINGVEFHSSNLRLRGQGYSESEAVRNAVGAILPDDNRLNDFFATAKKKIISYYKENTAALQTKAMTLANMGSYDEALALLSSYPVGLPEYSKVAETMKEIYASYQQHACTQIIQQARGAYATAQYDACIDLLNEVDMSSPCAADARALANKVRSAVSADKAQEIALYKEEMQTAAEIEKRRIQAIENVAVAYYKNQTKLYFIF